MVLHNRILQVNSFGLGGSVSAVVGLLYRVSRFFAYFQSKFFPVFPGHAPGRQTVYLQKKKILNKTFLFKKKNCNENTSCPQYIIYRKQEVSVFIVFLFHNKCDIGRYLDEIIIFLSNFFLFNNF